jgi:rhodanese-related sulfurtransferase
MHGRVELGYPHEMTVAELAENRRQGERFFLLNVREDWELAICAVPDAAHVPMAELPSRLEELPDDRRLVVICHHGLRSAQVVAWLRAQGLTNAVNLSGGIDAWVKEVDPSLPSY